MTLTNATRIHYQRKVFITIPLLISINFIRYP
jgi:hypothetical protein